MPTLLGTNMTDDKILLLTNVFKYHIATQRKNKN